MARNNGKPIVAPLLKRFPSLRCASAIQIVRPLESIAETQPKLVRRKMSRHVRRPSSKRCLFTASIQQ
jgi:hypothetical protein